jgi:hypothetical protein
MSVLYAKPRIKPTRKTIRKPGPFGRGVFPRVRPFEPSHADRIDLATMATVPAKPAPTPLNWIDRLAEQIRGDLVRIRELGERQDALYLKLHGIAPICGGAPTKFEPSEEDWADFYGWTDEPVHRVPGDDDMAYVGAVG